MRPPALLALFALLPLLSMLLLTPVVQAQAIRIEPGARVLDGEPLAIVVDALPPGSEATLSAERWFAPLAVTAARPRLYRSSATFRADAAGRIDLRSAAPLHGTYAGADPRGLFWSMRRVDDEVPAAGPVNTAQVRLQLHLPGQAPGQGPGQPRPVASAAVELMPALPEVQVEAVPTLPGALYARLPGAAARPAIIVVGGSEGGSLIVGAAAPLASHGFAVLALPLYSPPDPHTGRRELEALPAGWVEMPVEVLDRAREWLLTRPEVDGQRIGLHGTSFGGALVLLAGVHRPWVKAVVANVPSDVVWEGWGPGVAEGSRSSFSLAGEPLPFVSSLGYAAEWQNAERGEPVLIRRPYERGRAAQPARAAAARIAVERIGAPVMVIGAYDDQMWPSGPMAQAMAERRLEAGLPTEALLFSDAGHQLSGTGYDPTTQYNRGLRKSGGTPEGTARAQAETWTRTLRFLQRTLGGVPPR